MSGCAASAILTADAGTFQQGKPKPVRPGAPESIYLDVEISYAFSVLSASDAPVHALRMSSHVTHSTIA